MFRYLVTTPARVGARQLLLRLSSLSLSSSPFCTSSSSWSDEEVGLVKCQANYAPLTPISFLDRAAKVFADRPSLIYGETVSHTWSHTHQRCLRLASALSQTLRVSPGQIVATLAPNVPEMYELHFAVPMAGAVLCALNTRLDSPMLSTLLSHSQAKVLFVDSLLLDIALPALQLMSKPPLVVLITDKECDSAGVPPRRRSIDVEYHEYDHLLAHGDDQFSPILPNDECDPISVNYTSGTTSRPKGVVYNHRGAYLNAISTFLLHDMPTMPTYLWTVPMFHCNGWCLPWGLAALGGTNICLRKVTPKEIFDKIVLHNVTHMGAAPTVLNMIVNSPVSDQRPLPHKVRLLTGGSPPPPQILLKMEDMGFEVGHLYGLTETYGPATYCVWKPEWDSFPPHDKARMKSRQGVQHISLEDVDIKDPVTMESVPLDGKTPGEVMFKGNTVMSGYLNDLNATKEAFRGGWFHSGDLAVRHPDGYIEIKDRLKDVIISGGENISTVEVETVLYNHPGILEAAVVARPDDHWGETPCAFVKLKDGYLLQENEIIMFCRDHLPHYMAPKTVVFQEIPKTATGKIQKFVLREKAKAMGSLH